ncbi:MAG: MFS transporter [Candidatus Nezhaarchaeales archaeon]
MVTVICFLGFVFFGFNNYMMSATMPQIISEFGLGDVETGLLLGASFLGMFFGALLFGEFADRIGRRSTFQVTILIYSLFTSLIAVAPSWILIFLLRFIAGLGLGGLVPVTLAYLSEYLPARIRGRIMAWSIAMFSLGIALSYALTLFIGLNYGWRWIFVIGITPIVIALMARRVLPESVRYLLKKGEVEKALEIVEEIEKRTVGVRVLTRETIMMERTQAQDVIELGIRYLFTHRTMRVTIVFSLIWTTVCFVCYAISPWLLIFIQRELKYPLTTGLLYLTTTTLIGMVGTFTSGLLCDYLGRRITLSYSIVLSVAFLYALFALGGNPSLGLLLLSLQSIFLASAWGAVYAFTPESFPTEVRASAVGFCSSVGRLVSFVGPTIVGLLYTMGGIFPVLTVSMIMAIIAMVAALAAKETKGLMLEEITKATRLHQRY